MSTAGAENQDPGWGNLGQVARAYGRLHMRSTSPSGEDLRSLRATFVVLASMPVPILVVVVLLVTTGSLGAGSDPLVTSLATVGGGALMLLLQRVVAPTLRCDSEQELAESYRKRFFTQVGFALSPALMGFMGFVLSGHVAPYLIGAAIAAVGLVAVAPTSARVAAQQDDLSANGCPHRLLDALATSQDG